MSRTKGYKCFNIKCGSCIGKTLCGEPEDTALGCVGRVIGKPMTNADRIRAMTDEELAEYVCRNSINTLCDIICGGECNAISTLKRSGDWACKEIVMKWLQQPAGEEDKHEPN